MPFIQSFSLPPLSPLRKSSSPSSSCSIKINRIQQQQQQAITITNQNRIRLYGLFDFLQPDPEKEREKEEMYQEQQRILEMRKNKGSMETYYKDVEDRRNAATAKAKAKMSPSTGKGNTDPMKAWLDIKKKGLVAEPTRYDDEPKEGSLPLPLNPIGMSEYDEGARFDLRLPYVDKGYVDEDATISGAFRKMFGGGGSKSKKEEEEVIEEVVEEEEKKKGWWGF